MQLRLKNKQDFLAGLMFVGFGLLAIVVARDYPMGSAMRMGPGYFPTYLGALLMLVGAIIAAISIRTEGEPLSGFAWRPLIMLCLGFVAYGLSMGVFNLGFIPSIVLVVVVSALAAPGIRPLELALLTVVLAALTTGLFIYGIDLPYPLWGGY